MNINDRVWVRLNESGWKLFDGYHMSLGLDPTPYRQHIDTPSGHQRFHLWELMHIFGEACYLGAASPFEMAEVLTEDPNADG